VASLGSRFWRFAYCSACRAQPYCNRLPDRKHPSHPLDRPSRIHDGRRPRT